MTQTTQLRTTNPCAMLLAIAIAAMTLTGCVIVPVPTALADPEPFTPERLTSIQIGHTTRDDVRALFAAWSYETDDGMQTAHLEPLASDDDQYWMFSLRRQIGDVAYAGLVVYFPVILPVWEGRADNYLGYWVLLEFDAAQRVSGFWIIREGDPCVAGGVCFRDGRLLMLEDEASNALARSPAAEADRCTLFVYAAAEFDAAVTVSNGQRSDPVFGKATFLRADVTDGIWNIAASVVEAERGETEPSVHASQISGSCSAGGAAYVELTRVRMRLAAKQVDAARGAKALANRYVVERALATDAVDGAQRHPIELTPSPVNPMNTEFQYSPNVLRPSS